MIASIGHEYRMAGEFESCVKAFDQAIAIKDGGEVRTERALCKHGLKDDKGDPRRPAGRRERPSPPTLRRTTTLAGGSRCRSASRRPPPSMPKYLELAPNGSLAGPASEKMKAAQDAMSKDKGGTKKK